MASSSRDSGPEKKKFKSDVKAIDFIRKDEFFTRCSDDLQVIRMKKKTPGDIKLSSSPNLTYLNLLDYEDKKSDFHSNILTKKWDSVLINSSSSGKTFETYKRYISASIFCYYVKYLQNIPKNLIDVKVFDKKICNVVKHMEYWSESFRKLITYKVVSMCFVPQTEKILLPIILKHVCNTHNLINYCGERIFRACNPGLLKELLDACIDSGFNFWNLWQKNPVTHENYFCKVLACYFQGSLDYLRVLLDYGFKQTENRLETLRIMMSIHDFPWLRPLISRYSQSPKDVAVLEVFLFIQISVELSRDPHVVRECFRLIWESRKDPCVTKQQLIRIYEDYIQLRYEGSIERLLNEMMPSYADAIDDFRNRFPNCLNLVRQPRSLKHLCKCTVRDILHESIEMLRGVAKLDIPEDLKSYIMLR